ncbi:MAG: hypothetical protein CMJ89_13590 [Planctomycetes bacterium]|jgi:hypothetical protein|nr:hypothetical protein [Planctomycetota bacterium]
MLQRFFQTLFLLFVVGTLIGAQRINFEALPGGGGRPADGMPIDNHWRSAPYFVAFALEGTGPSAPQIAWAGGVLTAFDGVAGGLCDVTSVDMPVTGQGADCTFLTDDGVAGPPGRPYTYRVTYSQPVMEASGILLDVDGVESYHIEALDEMGLAIPGVFMDVDAMSPGSGNGQATPWGLVTGDPSRPIHVVRIEYTGPMTGPDMGDGISFDNYAPSTSCPARVKHNGGGLSGANNRLARISVGCPEVGNPGAINIFNAPGGAAFCLIIANATSIRPFGSCGSADTVIAIPGNYMTEAVLNGPFGLAGAGSISMPYGPMDPSFGQQSFSIQAAFVDPGVSCGFSLSEIVKVKIP